MVWSDCGHIYLKPFLYVYWRALLYEKKNQPVPIIGTEDLPSSEGEAKLFLYGPDVNSVSHDCICVFNLNRGLVETTFKFPKACGRRMTSFKGTYIFNYNCCVFSCLTVLFAVKLCQTDYKNPIQCSPHGALMPKSTNSHVILNLFKSINLNWLLTLKHICTQSDGKFFEKGDVNSLVVTVKMK